MANWTRNISSRLDCWSLHSHLSWEYPLQVIASWTKQRFPAVSVAKIDRVIQSSRVLPASLYLPFVDTTLAACSCSLKTVKSTVSAANCQLAIKTLLTGPALPWPIRGHLFPQPWLNEAPMSDLNLNPEIPLSCAADILGKCLDQRICTEAILDGPIMDLGIPPLQGILLALLLTEHVLGGVAARGLRGFARTSLAYLLSSCPLSASEVATSPSWTEESDECHIVQVHTR